MDLLQGLTEFFGAKQREYGMAKDVLTDAFSKVRKLLQHEVHFRGEQKTLLEAANLYAPCRRSACLNCSLCYAPPDHRHE